MTNLRQEVIATPLAACAPISIASSMRRLLRATSMSRVNYRLGYLVDLGCVLAFAYLGFQSGIDELAIVCVFVGALVFSFVEYAMHRWLFHTRWMLTGELHASHHDNPNRPTALPFWSSAICAPMLLWILTSWCGEAVAHWTLCGFFAAYLLYGVLHHLQHSIRIKDVPILWLRRKWIAHAVHHGREDVNFGVTTALWDRVFGTYLPPKR